MTAVAGLARPMMAQASEKLKLAFIPQENPDKLLGDVHTISAWLSEQMNLPVSGFVNRNRCDGRSFRSARVRLLSR